MPVPSMTLDAFWAWVESTDFPDTGKVTYYCGRVLFDISPEYFDSHARLKLEITYEIETLVRAKDLGELFIDGSWFTHSEAGVSNEPDVMFARWETLYSQKLRVVLGENQSEGDGKELRGTPDWVGEILSDSSERKDLRVLREAYFRAGIPEYWLLDARGEEIDFKLLVAGKEGYEETPADAEGWRRSPVFDCEFHLSRHRDRVNRWRYVLRRR